MLIRAIFRYNTPLALLAGLLALYPFQYSVMGFSQDTQYACLAAAFLMMAVLIFNKAAAIAEHAGNPLALPLNPGKKRAATIVACIFFALPLPWVALNSLYFLGAYLGLAALFYLFGAGVGGFRLKNIFLIKNVAFAGGFALLVLAPYRFLAPDIMPEIFAMHAIGTFLLMLAADIFADIRDAKGDKAAGIRTIPNILGPIAGQIASIAFIAAYGVYMAALHMPNLPEMMAYFLMAAIVVIAPRAQTYWLYHAIPLIWIAMTAVTLLKKILL